MLSIKSITIKLWIAALAALFAGNLYAANIGKFSLVIGTVEIRDQGGAWQTAKTGTNVTDTMEINTAYKSSAVITLQNGSRIKIDQASFLAMEKYKSGEFGSVTDMSLKQGSVTAFVEKIAAEDQQNHMRIRTPTLVAGVRGTIEQVIHNPDTGTEVILHESAADIVNKAGKISRVPQGGSHTANMLGEGLGAADNMNKENSAILSDNSMSADEANGLLERGDPMFSGSGADVEQLIDEASHRVDDMADFLQQQLLDSIPADIERL